MAAFLGPRGFPRGQPRWLLGVSRSYIHRVELGRQIGPEPLPLVCRRTGLAPEIIRPDLARVMRRAQAAE